MVCGSPTQTAQGNWETAQCQAAHTVASKESAERESVLIETYTNVKENP